MRSNRAVNRPSNLLLKSMILATFGMAVSYTSAAPVEAVKTASEGELVSLKVGAQKTQSLFIHSPLAKDSFADIIGGQGPYQMLLRNKVIVRIENADHLRSLIESVPSELGQVVIDGTLGARSDTWELTTENVRSAVALAELLSQDSSVGIAFVDSGRVANRDGVARFFRQKMGSGSTQSSSVSGDVGIKPVNPDVNPAGTTDPELASFWHMQNTLPIYLGRDNNITPAIYDTLGYTGDGVTVGISRSSNIQHLDFDHTDIDDNYDAVLTMPVDTTLFPPDRVLTSYAGIVAAERDNGEGGHGIAPGAKFAMMSTGTDLLLANMLDYERDNIDIKVIPSPFLINEFTTSVLSARYNDGEVAEFVNDYFVNTLKFGRNQKGAILIFSGGFSADFNMLPVMQFYPDNHDGGGFDDLLAGNELSIVDEDTAPGGGLNEFTSGPIYIRAQAYMYPFASDRQTFLINGVGEDGFADMNQAIGPSVFASVYTGTSNAASFYDNAGTRPRGVFAAVPGSITDELPDRTNNWLADGDQFLDVSQVNGSSAAIAGGIIALMLEANPSLTIRDIQHILFESIFESTRSAAIRFPEFDPSLVYLNPFALSGQTGVFSFWQINSGLYELPGGGVASIRHSDQYGFGVVDAELAVTKAMTWSGAPKLIVLDTGRVDEDSGIGDQEETRVPLNIPDATFLAIGETQTFLIDGANRGDLNQINICVRNNLVIESIVVEITVEGSGFNDIFFTLDSPWGTSSNLSYPVTRNAPGTTFTDNLNDDDRDAVYGVGTLGNTPMALIRHRFTTLKHWGELSGGTWRLNFYDFGPDTENEEGTPQEDGPPVVPAIPNVHTLGVFGLPGSDFREEKIVTAFRIQIYGYDTGEDVFLGCNPFNTSCPADLNADGIVNSADFILFIQWYLAGDIRADLTDNGIVDFLDLSAYRAIYQPGFCTIGGGAPPLTGGRPVPGTGDASDSNPPSRPI